MRQKDPTIEIDSLAYGGSGVGRYMGKAVFIPLTAPGDRISFRKIREKKGYIEGELVEIIEPSVRRRQSPCSVFGDCGGCSWQHLPYDRQVRAKDEIFGEILWRIGTVEKERILPITKAPSEWNYRNRAQFKARFIDGRLHVGFYRRKSHFVVDIDHCPLMSGLINRTISELKAALGNAPFRDRMPGIDIAVDDLDERAVAVIHLKSAPSGKHFDFAKKLEGMDGLHGLYFQAGSKETLVEVFSGEDGGYLSYTIDAGDRQLDLAFSPAGFTQVNYAQNRRLASEVLALAGANSGKVVDLYCGVGNFTLPLSLKSNEVTGIENNKVAVADGRQNAAAADVENCRFIAGESLKVLDGMKSERFDLAVIDPPREGSSAVLRKLAEMKVPRVIYVSCNPSTLARDLKILSGIGYEVVSSRPIDLFPQTYHIESVTEIRSRG